MTDINTWNASGGPETEYQTIEISDGTNVFRFVNGWEDLELGVDGLTQTFTAIGSEFDEPVKNEDGSQDLRFSISNIDGIVSNYIIESLRLRRKMNLTRRVYLSSDTTQPCQPAEFFEIKGGSFDAFSVTVNAGYFDILSTSWPRRLRNLEEYPGLRYL